MLKLIITFIFILSIQSQQCIDYSQWNYNSNLNELIISGNGEMCNCKEIEKYINFDFLQVKNITIENGITTIGKSCFSIFKNVKNIKISETVEKIQKWAFYGLTIEEIYIPQNIKQIGESSFEECQQLKKINFSEDSKLEIIEKAAFKGCISLQEIFIPNNVKTIGKHCFDNCKNMKKINFGENVEEIHWSIFEGLYDLEEIIINENNQYLTAINNVIYSKDMKTLIYYSSSKNEERFEMPEGVEILSEFSFKFTQLKRIILPESLKEIHSVPPALFLVAGFWGRNYKL